MARLAGSPRARGAARARAGRARARVLERALSERGCDVPEHPARHRQDAYPKCACALGRRARGGAPVSASHPICTSSWATTSQPRSSSASRAHTSFWFAPGLHPSFPPSSSSRPQSRTRSRSCRAVAGARWRCSPLLLRSPPSGRAGSQRRPATPTATRSRSTSDVPMHGTEAAPNAVASIAVGERDESDNWPMAMTIRGLPRLPEGQHTSSG